MKPSYYSCFLFVLAACFGCQALGVIGTGNIYSSGYKDGYIQGVSEKREGLGGLGYVGSLKVSFHGYGSTIDPMKEGQPQVGWIANFYDKKFFAQVQQIRGDQLVRVFYEEKDIQLEGETKYQVTKILVLPAAGEPIKGD